MRRWTKEEVRVLEDYYSDHGLIKCLELLDRTKHQIIAKASELNIKYKFYHFSKDNVQFLKDNYESKGPQWCAKILNRKVSSVRDKATKLKLKDKSRWSDSDDEFLKENYIKYGTVYCANKLRYSKRKVSRKANELGLYRPYELKYKDYKGKKVNNILLVKPTKDLINNEREWLMQCLLCGNLFYNTATRVINDRVKSCGCISKKFKSGTTRKTERKWENGKWIHHQHGKWRRKVCKLYEEQECQICCDTYKLEAHHLNGFDWCKEERYDPNNGIILCHFHHMLFHDKYGRGNNTREQFIEFFKDNFSPQWPMEVNYV